MDDQKRALHALNRLTFGPRPGDVERVTAIGVDKWIDQQLHPEKIDDVPDPYARRFTGQQAIDAVVRSAGRTLVLVSGGSKAGDDAMLEKARESMEAGATGLIFGRNVWQRDHDESLRFVSALRDILAKYPST